MKEVIKETHQQFVTEFLPYADALFNYASYMSGDAVYAQDLVQETFMRAFRYKDYYQEGSNPKAWLFRILKNIYINEYRKNSRAPHLVELEEQLYFANKGSVGMDTEKLEYHFGDDIITALDMLPGNLRSVFLLKYVEDFKYEEIAAIYDLPMGTVKIWLHRSKKLLREIIGEIRNQPAAAAS